MAASTDVLPAPMPFFARFDPILEEAAEFRRIDEWLRTMACDPYDDRED